MSGRLLTVAELREALSAFPDDAIVVTQGAHPHEWDIEGTVDGPRVLPCWLHEVRTGHHLIAEDEFDPAAGQRRGVLLTDMYSSEADLRAHQNKQIARDAGHLPWWLEDSPG